MNHEPADAQLLRRLATGDASAMGGLYDRYAGPLFGLALRILRDRTEAEDVLHDAFIIVGDRASQYSEERGGVGSWLVVLVRNLCIDRLRRRNRHERLSRRACDVAATAATVDAERSMTSLQQTSRMRRVLESLPASQRKTLESAFFEGMTYAEIAAREGVPLGTVKSRAARAIAALRAWRRSARVPGGAQRGRHPERP